MSDIRFENVTLSYGDEVILRDFSCEIRVKGVTSVIGPSGSGKTTFLKSVLGLKAPKVGMIHGIPKRISAVFQEDRLFEDFTVWKNVLAVCPEYVHRKRILERELNEIGLKDVLEKKVYELSGGMKRRISILRALLFASDFVVMDEPFRGLDEETESRTREWVARKLCGRGLLIGVHEKSDVQSWNPVFLDLGAPRGANQKNS